VGGRDRSAGGTWCASDIRSGTTAVVLNRPEKRVADAGASSRGVLPLLAVRALDAWTDDIDLAPMASFILVLATPESLRWWSYDGATLRDQRLDPGVHMFTPRGLSHSSLSEQFAQAAVGGESDESVDTVWSAWHAIVRSSEPSDDPTSLLVHISRDGDAYQTVFGQFISAAPGELHVRYTTTPQLDSSWTSETWPSD
jgi:hypothetical protein